MALWDIVLGDIEGIGDYIATCLHILSPYQEQSSINKTIHEYGEHYQHVYSKQPNYKKGAALSKIVSVKKVVKSNGAAKKFGCDGKG